MPALGVATVWLVRSIGIITSNAASYAAASAVATETLGAIRVTAALNYQPQAARRYASYLGKAQQDATRSLWHASFAGGSLFATMFFMYALGLWYGEKLIADSSRRAMRNHPAPMGLLDVNSLQWGAHARYATDLCYYNTDASKPYTGDALINCACALNYQYATPLALPSPQCGCGFRGEGVVGLNGASPCLSGGDVTMVFFSVLIGGFALGIAGPALEAITKARAAAHKLYAVIDRKPAHGVDARTPVGKALEGTVVGNIEFTDVYFSYSPERPVFAGLHLSIGGGQVVALVGASGTSP